MFIMTGYDYDLCVMFDMYNKPAHIRWERFDFLIYLFSLFIIYTFTFIYFALYTLLCTLLLYSPVNSYDLYFDRARVRPLPSSDIKENMG